MWTLLEYSGRKTSEADHDASPLLFILSDTVLASLQILRKALNARNPRNVEDALRTLFDNLYFPSKEERDRAYRRPVHVFPILQFIIFSFITSNGAYQQIHRLPPMLSQHQYCLRLRGLHCINNEIVANGTKDWRRSDIHFNLVSLFNLMDISIQYCCRLCGQVLG